MPSIYTSLAGIAFNQATAQNNELLQRLWGLRVVEGGGLSINGFGDTDAVYEGEGDGDKNPKSGILHHGADNHWGMFVDGNGIFSQANAAAVIPNYNSQSGGVSVGLSYKWNQNFLTGLYSGYEGTTARYNDGSRMINNAVRFGLFGMVGQPDGKGFYLMGMAGGAYNQYAISRAITLPKTIVPTVTFPDGVTFPSFTLPGTNATATSTPGAGEIDSMLAGGYDLKKGNFTFGPTTSLQYTFFDAFPITEAGAGNLNFSSTSWYNASLLYSLGGHVAYTWQVNRNILVLPQISLSWQHEFLQSPYAINGTSPVPVTSTTPLRDTLYTGVGFTVEIGRNWDTSLFYNASAGNQDLVSQNIFWSAGVKF